MNHELRNADRKTRVNSSHKIELVNDLRVYDNIVLSGGRTLFKGLGEQLYHELDKLAKESVNISANIWRV